MKRRFRQRLVNNEAQQTRQNLYAMLMQIGREILLETKTKQAFRGWRNLFRFTFWQGQYFYGRKL